MLYKLIQWFDSATISFGRLETCTTTPDHSFGNETEFAFPTKNWRRVFDVFYTNVCQSGFDAQTQYFYYELCRAAHWKLILILEAQALARFLL